MQRQACIAEGTANKFEDHHRRPLAEHLAEWKADMIARGNTKRHARGQHDRAEKLLTGIKAVHWPDVDPVRAQAWVHGQQQQEDALSRKTAS